MARFQVSYRYLTIVQLQSDPLTLKSLVKPVQSVKYKGLWPTAKIIFKEEGFFAFWKGNLSAEYLYLTYGAVQFYTLDKMHQFLSPHCSLGMTRFLSGAIAGLMATTATYPFDLLRTRFAVQQGLYKGILPAIQQIYQQEGLKGFYRGLWPTYLQILPTMGLIFWSQPLFSQLGQDIGLGSFWSHFIGGGCAGILSKTVVMPLDVMRFSK
jgi:solute carrier family 25 thiamine pyrophosphate transporter 19